MRSTLRTPSFTVNEPVRIFRPSARGGRRSALVQQAHVAGRHRGGSHGRHPPLQPERVLMLGGVLSHPRERGGRGPDARADRRRSWREGAGAADRRVDTRTWTSLPSNVPLICTVKFCASVSFTVIPGTFVHAVDVVVAGVVTAAQSMHDARVPVTVVARLSPYAIPVGTSTTSARPTAMSARCFCISILLALAMSDPSGACSMRPSLPSSSGTWETRGRGAAGPKAGRVRQTRTACRASVRSRSRCRRPVAGCTCRSPCPP